MQLEVPHRAAAVLSGFGQPLWGAAEGLWVSAPLYAKSMR